MSATGISFAGPSTNATRGVRFGALNRFKKSRENRDRDLERYDRLNRTAEGAVRAADSDAMWWPSSPSPGPLSFGVADHLDGATQDLAIYNLPSSFTPKRD